MSKSKGMKVASLFAGLLLCMILMPTAFAAGNQNQPTINFTNTGNMNDSSITIAPTITQTEVAKENAPTDNPIVGNLPTENLTTGNAPINNPTVGNASTDNQMEGELPTESPTTEYATIENPTIGNVVVNNVSPSYSSTYLVAGSSTQLNVTFNNSGNETLILNPKLVSTFNSVSNINESWITISPTNVTVAPGSKQDFTIELNIPKDAESGNYQATIAFTNDSTQVNSMQLAVSVQALPKIELQASYISDSVEAGKEYEYKIKIKNVAEKDITIDPKLNNYNYYSSSTQALGNDAIEISVPSTIKAGEVANMTMRVHVPENATGYYSGDINMNVDGKINDGSSPQINLWFSIWQQPTVPYVETFNTTTNAPITIEVSTSKYDSDMGLRTSPIKEKPSFELGLTCNSSPVNMTLVKTAQGGNVNTKDYSFPNWVMEDGSSYQSYSSQYIKTYTVPGEIGNWELTILPKNTNNFGYSIANGDSNLAITGNKTIE